MFICKLASFYGETYSKLSSMKEKSIEKKDFSQVSGHRRKLGQIFKKIKLISSAVRQVIWELGNLRSLDQLVKDT